MKRDKPLEEIETDLQIDERIDAHLTGFKVQKVGLAGIGIIVLLAAAGLFGNGLVSTTTHSASAWSVEYEQFFRYESRMTLKFQLHEAPADSSIIALSNDYLKHFKIDAIVPEPSGNRIINEQVHFAFEGPGAKEVIFYIVPQKIGSLQGELKVQNDVFKIHHFIYP